MKGNLCWCLKLSAYVIDLHEKNCRPMLLAYLRKIVGLCYWLTWEKLSAYVIALREENCRPMWLTYMRKLSAYVIGLHEKSLNSYNIMIFRPGLALIFLNNSWVTILYEIFGNVNTFWKGVLVAPSVDVSCLISPIIVCVKCEKANPFWSSFINIWNFLRLQKIVTFQT